MKRRFYKKLIPTAIFLCFSIFYLSANNIDGRWYAEKYSTSVEIEQTYTGIRVKRNNQNDWYYYDKKGSGLFEDVRGNQYRFIASDRLVWRDNTGKQEFVFRRNSNSNQRQYDYDDRYRDNRSYEREYERNRYRGNDWFNNRNNRANRVQLKRYLRSFEGRWFNSFNRRLTIDARSDHLRIKHRGIRTKFYMVGPGRFESRYGDVLTARSSNRMRLSFRGERPIIITRQSNAYCR